jgi:hypothetical protein
MLGMPRLPCDWAVPTGRQDGTVAQRHYRDLRSTYIVIIRFQEPCLEVR